MAWLELTRRQSREIDRIAIEEYGISGLVLMENAAHGIYAVAIDPSFVGNAAAYGYTVLCGKGNNGGDGLAVARLLLRNGRKVRLLLVDPPAAFAGDAAVQLGILQNMSVPLESAAAFLSVSEPIPGVLIDAVYGTGFRPPSAVDFVALDRRLRGHESYVIAIDVPSGFDADTGFVEHGNAIRADVTVTMMTRKRGFSVNGAEHYVGRAWTVGLGIPYVIAERAAASPE